jgi:hypothetical protein
MSAPQPDPLRRALAGESAAALGRLGQRLEASLQALRALGDGEPADDAERERRVYACADAVWLYFVQREVCGLVNHEYVIEAYGIPWEVLTKVGASRPR